MLNSSDAEERAVAEQLRAFFPNENSRGAHTNISGAGMTASARNVEAALSLLEPLTDETAQRVTAYTNYEYPVNRNVQPAPLLKSWRELKGDSLGLHPLGANNAAAPRIFDQVG